jgi:lycopene beta-cyclase
MKIITRQDLLSEYDYVFAGGGCAAWSLLFQLAENGLAATKKILVADSVLKHSNDRTWCFWESEPGPFEQIVHHQWPVLDFYTGDFSRAMDISPYFYKLIRGADFYRMVQSRLASLDNIHFLEEKVEQVWSSAAEGTGLRAGGHDIKAGFLFSSIYKKPDPRPGLHWLLQHFKGWWIETEKDEFDPGRATLMDFRIDQSEGTTFMYLLPFSKRRALVEYTLFTEKILPDAAYDAALAGYLRDRGISHYKITEEERGVIPMTNHRFPAGDHHIIYLGTAGGQTKASSGYTFKNIQRHSRALADCLQKNGDPFGVEQTPARFHFYDSVLLDILGKRTLEGADIFCELFRKNDPASVLRFLDNQSSVASELQIIRTLPTMPFARAAWRQVFH